MPIFIVRGAPLSFGPPRVERRMEDRDSFLVSTHAGGPNGGNFVMGPPGRAARPSAATDIFSGRQKTSMVAFAIKAEVRNPKAKTFAFTAQKTMYCCKHIAGGDTVFVFASENEEGQGLIARGIVTSVEAIAKKRGIARRTPRVSISITCTALAKRPLGRRELKHLTDWDDGQPGTELVFKFYRQATGKIVGISDEAAAFLSEILLGPWRVSEERGEFAAKDRIGCPFDPIREGEPSEKKYSAIAFLKKAVAYYDSLGVTVDRMMTDKHVRTKPYTRKTILRFHS